MAACGGGGGGLEPQTITLSSRHEKRFTRRMFLIVWLGIGTTLIASSSSSDGRTYDHHDGGDHGAAAPRLRGQRFNRPNIEKFMFPPIMSPDNFPDVMGRTMSDSGEDKKPKSVRELILGEASESEYDEKGRKIKKEYKGGFIHQNTRDAIRNRRIALKMTRKDLADRMNLPLRIVAGWEEGTVQPDPVTFNLFQNHLSAILPVPEYPTFYGEKYSWESSSEDDRSDFEGFEDKDDRSSSSSSKKMTTTTQQQQRRGKTLEEWAEAEDNDAGEGGEGRDNAATITESTPATGKAAVDAAAEDLAAGLDLFDKQEAKT